MTNQTFYKPAFYVVLILLIIGTAYYYITKPETISDRTAKTDSLLVEIGKQLQHLADTENQARPMETRYITQKTVYRNISEKVKGLKADEKVKANHEYIRKFKGVDEVPEKDSLNPPAFEPIKIKEKIDGGTKW